MNSIGCLSEEPSPLPRLLMWHRCFGSALPTLPQSPSLAIKHTWFLCNREPYVKFCLSVPWTMDARASRPLLPLSLVVALSLPHPRLPQLRSRPARLPWEQTSKPWLRYQCWHLPGTPNSCEVVSSNPFILVCKGMAGRGEKPWHSLIDEELKTTVNILEAHNFYYLLGMSRRRNSSTGNESE